MEACQIMECPPSYYLFSCLLTILLVLHFFWFYHIAKMAYVAYHKDDGNVEKDSRSDEEDTDESD